MFIYSIVFRSLIIKLASPELSSTKLPDGGGPYPIALKHYAVSEHNNSRNVLIIVPIKAGSQGPIIYQYMNISTFLSQ